jgi:S1-C subfamily serine protease
MANILKDISASLRDTIKKAAAYTVGLEREPYAVSGVLIGGDRVLTASHLVPDEGIGVLMPDGTTVKAKVAGRDPINDLALLRLEGKGNAPVPPSAAVEVGDLVVSLKRDPFDGINASLAMVSASGAKLKLGRSAVLDRYLQVDAERFPGTTGGPIANADGAFAGILVFNRRMGAEVAIPADIALARAKLLEEKGSVKRPYLGVRSQAVALPRGAQETGLLLVTVEKGSAADAAGLEVGDIIITFGGVTVLDHETLVGALAEKGAGAKVDVQIMRGGAPRTVSLTIGAE